jgi:hexosaminidase
VKYLDLYNEKYKGSGEYTLANGVRGTTNHNDGEWQAWSATNMEVVIDLQEPSEIHTISLGSLQNVAASIFFPKKMEFFVSDDGVKFQKVAELGNDVDPLSAEKQLKEFTVSFKPVKPGYVKVIAYNIGKCPIGSPGEGKDAWMFVDEILVD